MCSDCALLCSSMSHFLIAFDFCMPTACSQAPCGTHCSASCICAVAGQECDMRDNHCKVRPAGRVFICAVYVPRALQATKHSQTITPQGQLALRTARFPFADLGRLQVAQSSPCSPAGKVRHG